MTACPPLDELRRRVENPSESHDDAFADHIEHCPACQEVLDRLTIPDFRPHLATGDGFGRIGDTFRQQLEQEPPAPTVSIGSDQSDTTLEGPSGWPEVAGYEVLGVLGRGGMGVVYKARQLSLNRVVALKMILARATDSKEVVSRFEAERQALTLMDHPNIARVVDAGDSGSGRPYFVMELVEGVPITKYCDDHRLGTVERLNLFVPVCLGAQHAHQKGIIHRDVKPSNVLVAVVEGKPVPKVIDFGVAKAVGPRLTERTMNTEIGAVVGTLEYMSPEQAELGGIDIDTRSDIFSLGVLLYELLTGGTPLGRLSLKQQSFAEVLRRIREEESPRPSSRLSSTVEQLTLVADRRATDPERLKRAVQGDLDWIVMKSLEKERTRRYETASGFASDIERNLRGDPVEACPPSATYRLKKFAKKHRAGLAAAVGATLLLVTATILSTASMLRARSAETLANNRLHDVEQANANTTKALAEMREARAAAQAALARSEAARTEAESLSRFQFEAFRSPDPSQDGRNIKVVDLLDRAADRLDRELNTTRSTRDAMLGVLGETFRGLGLYDKAIAAHRKARASREAALGPDHPETLDSCEDLANAYVGSGRYDEAIRLHERTLKGREAVQGPDHIGTLKSRQNLAATYSVTGQFGRSIPLNEQALAARILRHGPNDPETLKCQSNLASDYYMVKRYDKARELYEPAVKGMTTALGVDHPDTLTARCGLASTYSSLGRVKEAITMQEATLKYQESRIGPDHSETLKSRITLAALYRSDGRTAEAVRLYERTLKMSESKLRRDHPRAMLTRFNLATVYNGIGRYLEAIVLFQENLAILERTLGPDHYESINVRRSLGTSYERLGRWSDAESMRREVLVRQRSGPKPDKWLLASDLTTLGRALLAQSKWSEAEPMLREALEIRETLIPDDWRRFSTMSMLGEAVAGQHRLDEAEPMLVGGYEGMIARKSAIPTTSTHNLDESAERIIRLYEAWGDPGKAARWKARLSRSELPVDVFARPKP